MTNITKITRLSEFRKKPVNKVKSVVEPIVNTVVEPIVSPVEQTPIKPKQQRHKKRVVKPLENNNTDNNSQDAADDDYYELTKYEKAEEEESKWLAQFVYVKEKRGAHLLKLDHNEYKPLAIRDAKVIYKNWFIRKGTDEQGEEWTKDMTAEFVERWGYMGRSIYAQDLTYSFADNVKLPKFNLLIKNFVEPVPCGEYNVWFDVLFRSLANDDPDKIEHLKQALYLKWKYPANTQIPCLVMLDNGGTGKTLFLEHLLPTVFGENMIIPNMTTEKFLDKFAPLGKKAVININEANFTREEMNSVKNVIGSKTLLIEEKFSSPIVVDNTAWYIITSNSTGGGAIQLSGEETDRRWSIFINESSKNMRHYVEEQVGHRLTTSEYRDIVLNEILPVLQSREEVGKLMFSLEEMWEGVTNIGPLHGEDYKSLLSKQGKSWEWVVEHVFNKIQPGVITVGELYEYYSIIHSTTVVNKYSPLIQREFSRNVVMWLEKHNVPYKKVMINDRTGAPTSKRGFVREGINTTIKNSSEYTKLVVEENYKKKPVFTLDEYPETALYSRKPVLVRGGKYTDPVD